MKFKDITTRKFLRSLRVIHLAMLVVVVIFCAFVLYIRNFIFVQQDDFFNEIFATAANIFAFLGLFGNILFFKIYLKSVNVLPELTDKLFGYRAALKTRYAILEGPAIFNILTYLLTGDLIFLVYTGLLTMIFILIKPSIRRMIADLKLTREETRMLSNPEEVIFTYKIL